MQRYSLMISIVMCGFLCSMTGLAASRTSGPGVQVNSISSGKDNSTNSRSLSQRVWYAAPAKKKSRTQQREDIERELNISITRIGEILDTLKRRHEKRLSEDEIEKLKAELRRLEIKKHKQKEQLKRFQEDTTSSRNTNFWVSEIQKRRTEARNLRMQAQEILNQADRLDMRNSNNSFSTYGHSRSLKNQAALRRKKADELKEKARQLDLKADELAKEYQKKKRRF